MTNITTIKGFADLFEPDSSLYSYLEQSALHIFGTYGYKELRTPILEYTDLFCRSIGTETDVVQKEMFTMADRKDRSLTMRPEATAGIMRAYIEHNCKAKENVSKFFTYGPMFRYERPQKGRMRQFHQLNCECLGAQEPVVDAEVILMLMRFLGEIGLHELKLEVNTLGCRECRPAYKEKLITYLKTLNVDNLCDDCRRRLETNPLRVLDCKVPSCKEMTKDAPQIGDCVCSACSDHFGVVLELLQKEKVRYVLNPRLVRGLDYYTRTTFEVVSTSIGAQGSVAGGGRYDGLIAQLGGADVPGIGFACGMERLALALENSEQQKKAARPDFFIASLDPKAPATAVVLAQRLREADLAGSLAYESSSMKSQMRQASKSEARFCLLLGEEELKENKVTIKNMDTGEQVTLEQDGLPVWAGNIRINRPA